MEGDNQSTRHCHLVKEVKVVLLVVVASKLVACGGRESCWKRLDYDGDYCCCVVVLGKKSWNVAGASHGYC